MNSTDMTFRAPPVPLLSKVAAAESELRRWASQPLPSSATDFLTAVGSEIPVSLISVSRAQIKCERTPNWETIETNAALADFDQVPLTDDCGLQIEGVFVRGVGRFPLREEMLIAADAPLLTFLESADSQRFRFLLSGSNISGMVTLSDVQKLPVYSVLFSLVMAVEMLLMEWIRKKCGAEPDKWMTPLDKGQRGTIEKYWQEARDRNLWIERLSFASIGQEIRAASKLGLFQAQADQEQKLKQLAELRHLVCHAAEFAPTVSEALKIPARVRDAKSVAAWLQRQIAECPS